MTMYAQSRFLTNSSDTLRIFIFIHGRVLGHKQKLMGMLLLLQRPYLLKPDRNLFDVKMETKYKIFQIVFLRDSRFHCDIS